MPHIKLDKVRAPLLAGVLALIPVGAIAAGMGGAMPMHSGAMTPPRTAPNVPGIKPSGSGRAETGNTTGVDSHTRFVRQDPITGTRLRSPVPVSGPTNPGVGVPVTNAPTSDTGGTVGSHPTTAGPMEVSPNPRTIDPPPPPQADTQ